MTQVKITVRNNGPFRVEGEIGSIEMVDGNGNAFDLSQKVKEGKTAFSLCRCGSSATKPFCDGTHRTIGFQASEPAIAVPGGNPVKG